MQIQVSIGSGSMGLVYRDVAESELAAEIVRCAAQMGYTPAHVKRAKAGGWYDGAASVSIGETQ